MIYDYSKMNELNENFRSIKLNIKKIIKNKEQLYY